jgi:hypothetical protein
MKRALWLGGAALALCSALVVAQDAPESLLPPGFDEPSPPPRAAARPSAAAPAARAPAAGTVASPVVQPTPGAPAPLLVVLPKDLPSLEQIESMTPDEIDELLGLKPKYDIPPGARRSLSRVGVLAMDEGGFPSRSLSRQPASLVRAALNGTRRPLVSRWGHILLRRALASRLDAPLGMNPVEFASLRTGLLNRIGEAVAARALVQDIDTSNYSPALVNAAFDSYLATGDIVGICPAMRIVGSPRKDGQWQLARQICAAFAGDASSASNELNKALSRGIAPRIDVLLAQRFAGAAGAGRRAVNIEWDGVEEITPWRFALASALGLDIPLALTGDAGRYYDRVSVLIPAVPLGRRADAADVAGEEGILSSSAMIDLYGQVLADGQVTGDAAQRAATLREAYVAEQPAERLKAIRQLWGNGAQPRYGRQVLTAHAAARLPVNDSLSDDAEGLVTSILAAGLDRNALRWGKVVQEGSRAWALLALAQPDRKAPVSAGAVDRYIDSDDSEEQRKSRFLVAGLAGLGRLQRGDAASLSRQLGVSFDRQTRWSQMIDKAAAVNNKTLVALLAGVGMQGEGWDKMTARHLYHIVAALHRVGLDAEARMIAAEAVARA